MEKINISIEDKKRYLDLLIGKVFKIIPICEENGKTHLTLYLWGLCNDVLSANSLFDGELIELIVKLNSIYEGKLTFAEMKKVVFDTIDTIKKINRAHIIEEKSFDTNNEFNLEEGVQDALNGRA